MTQRFERFDFSSTLTPPRFLDNGFAIISGTIARSGVLRYGDRREYTPSSLLFSQESLKALAGIPITREHPSRLLDGENAKRNTIGSIKTAQRRSDDSNFLDAELLIIDGAVVKALREGTAPTELSLGYSCELDDVPGTTPEGERYDSRRTWLEFNHLALTDRARGGSELRLRLDSADIDQPNDQQQTKTDEGDTSNMVVKLIIGGSQMDVPEALAPHIERLQGENQALKDKLAVAKKTAEQITKMDAAEAVSIARARLELESVAKRHCPKMDSAAIERSDDLQLIRATLNGLGSMRFKDSEGKSKEYLLGALNVGLVEHGSKALHNVRRAIVIAQDSNNQLQQEDAEQAAIRRANHALQNRWRTGDIEPLPQTQIKSDSIAAQMIAGIPAERRDDDDLHMPGLLADYLPADEVAAMRRADQERANDWKKSE